MAKRTREKSRCPWAKSELYIEYHDTEWGKPLYDDRLLFEFLILEGAQAGLSWLTILKRRDNYRKAFAKLDPEKIARFNVKNVETLMQNPGIIRNRLKIESTIINAKAYLQLVEHTSFSAYLWDFVAGHPIRNNWKILSNIPSRTDLSDKVANDLKKRGFKFVGSTICYAFMQ